MNPPMSLLRLQAERVSLRAKLENLTARLAHVEERITEQESVYGDRDTLDAVLRGTLAAMVSGKRYTVAEVASLFQEAGGSPSISMIRVGKALRQAGCQNWRSNTARGWVRP